MLSNFEMVIHYLVACLFFFMEGVHIYDGETNFDEDRKLK